MWDHAATAAIGKVVHRVPIDAEEHRRFIGRHDITRLTLIDGRRIESASRGRTSMQKHLHGAHECLKGFERLPL